MLLNSSATTFGHETVNSGTFFPSLLHFSIVLFLARANQSEKVEIASVITLNKIYARY